MKNNTEKSENELPALRHSLAHLLAAAVLDLYPDTKNTIGPAVDNGFYYDFEFAPTVSISDKDLKEIEKKMKKILNGWSTFDEKEVAAEEARAIFKNNPYKLELIDEIIGKGEKITLYTSGAGATSFTDLCRGGHIENAKEINTDAFELSRIAGAYWRGDEKNKMLTRIYGLAFETPEELTAYKHQQEEAKKRDHRKLGKELKLFTVSDLIGSGLPLMQPKGMIIRKEIEDYLWDLHKDKGYSRVWTPHIAKEALYVTSGHAAKFGDELFRVQGKEEKFIMKPMNCPHHMQIFADNQFSYRDMPVRYFEPATVYRDEKSGQLGGLTRVRAITQDDGHLFCRSTQIAGEAKTIIEIIKQFYTTMGMMDGYWVRLSLRGDDKTQYLGSDGVWNIAEKALADVCEAEKLPYKPAKGEAAFYGPKLDFMFKDAIGREWQLATIQCDFNLPERFDLAFVNEKGEKERPVVIHRAISGSLERFMGVMIEHYAGAFPLWLAPVQVRVLPITDTHHAYAREIFEKLKAEGLRAELDESHESLGKKIRVGKIEKVPYSLVIGDKELASGEATLESRDHGNLGSLTLAALVAKLTEEIKNKN
ncbi:MAG: threonine--tRNA ligase [Candidatus Pacebacteria bacterium]|nr:threonine--tRNA ligase [Candidatus Paceibacterota bacterium]